MIQFVFQKSLSFVVSGLMCFSVGWGVAGIVGWVIGEEKTPYEAGAFSAPESRPIQVPIYEDQEPGLEEYEPGQYLTGFYTPDSKYGMQEVNSIEVFYNEAGGFEAHLILDNDELDYVDLIDEEASFENSKLRFETNERDGEWYVFEGDLMFETLEDGAEEQFLRGTLTKYRFGHVVAVLKSDFEHWIGC